MTPIRRDLKNRLVALGLLLVVTIGVIAAIGLPTWSLHKRYNEILESSLDRLSRFRRIAQLRPQIENYISILNQDNTEKLYWKGNTSALVSADIQGTVSKIVDSNQGRIISSQALTNPDDKKGTSPEPVSISIQMMAAVVPMQLIFHSIETNTPYLFIDQLSIRSNQGRMYKPIEGVQPELIVQFTVRGYFQNGAGQKK